MMACVHDVLVTLGLYALLGYEFNLTTIAAFLTLVGYSVNDTSSSSTACARTCARPAAAAADRR